MAGLVGMGALPDVGGNQCGFRVWAPNARKVFVTGPFCQWQANANALVAEGNGYWSGIVAGVGVGEPYKYVIENGVPHWRVDAYARDVDSDASGNFHGLVVD